MTDEKKEGMTFEPADQAGTDSPEPAEVKSTSKDPIPENIRTVDAVVEGESRSDDHMTEFGFWEKFRHGVTHSYHVAADKTDLYARVGKRRLKILSINRTIDRSFNELGEKTYNLIAAGSAGALEDDLAVGALIGRIKDLEGELTAQEAEIEKIHHESREKAETVKTEV